MQVILRPVYVFLNMSCTLSARGKEYMAKDPLACRSVGSFRSVLVHFCIRLLQKLGLDSRLSCLAHTDKTQACTR